MRVCPRCFGLYGPTQETCPKDGTATQGSTEVLIGRELGPYVVRALIGEGGMGVVYSGEHPQLGKRVALKVLRPELSLRDDLVDRFVKEARAVSTIGHSNIVNVYDFGRTPFGSFYIAMEYLEGNTIRALLEQVGPQPLERVRMVMDGIGAALSAAHGKGFVHRDIKPENIMVVRRLGQEGIRLLDFGVVKLRSRDPGKTTTTGSGLGTPRYMCPEQLEDAAVDQRADIYALAIVAYEMLTGRVPYPGKTAAEVRQLQLTQTPVPPSVARVESRLSRSMDAAILWGMNVDPAGRCQRVEELVSAFELGYQRTLVEQTHAPTVAAHAAPKRQRTGLVVGLGLALLAAGAGAAAVLLLRGREPGPVGAGSGTAVQVRPDARFAATVIRSDAEASSVARARVVDALRSPSAETRSQVIEYLGRVGRPVMLSELRAAVADNDPRVNGQAAMALGRMGDREAIPAIRALLRESHGIPEIGLAEALATLGDRHGTERLLKRNAELRNINDPIKNQALFALGRLRHPAAQELRKYTVLDRTVVTKVWQALGLLAAMGDRGARTELEEAISGSDWDARVRAAEALAIADPSAAREALAAALAEAPDSANPAAALALAKLGDARGTDLLLASLHSPDSALRKEVTLALGRLRGAPAREALRAALADSTPDVALAAAVALIGP